MLPLPPPFEEHHGEIHPQTVQRIGRSGRLDLRFWRKQRRTVIGYQYQEVPFKVSRVFYSGNSPLARVIVMHTTAGLFGGDRLETRIQVDPGARAYISSQSATKVHPSGNTPAFQSVQIKVENDAELHYYLDPIIPFAGSHLQQFTKIQLSPGARFYFWDGLMGGRVSRGETWQFLEMQSEMKVLLDSDLIFLDRFNLRPLELSPTKKWAMNNHSYMATAIAYDPLLKNDSLPSLRNKIEFIQPDSESSLDIPHDFLLVGRFVSTSGASFKRARQSFQNVCLNLFARE